MAALEQWPATGVPENPAAWLMTTAKRRGIDHFRRADSLRRKVAELERMHEGEEADARPRRPGRLHRGRRPAAHLPGLPPVPDR